MNEASPTPSESLKLRTLPRHRETEQSAFSKALAQGQISRHAYTSLLWCQRVLHEDLLQALSRCGHPSVTGVVEDFARIVLDLRQDLDALAATTDDVPAAVQAAARSGCVALTESDRPYRLLGRLYVFEGSRLGGVMMCPSIRRGLGEDIPSRYFAGSGKGTLERWKCVKERLDRELTEPPALEQAVTAADDVFSRVGVVFAALWAVECEASAATRPL